VEGREGRRCDTASGAPPCGGTELEMGGCWGAAAPIAGYRKRSGGTSGGRWCGEGATLTAGGEGCPIPNPRWRTASHKEGEGVMRSPNARRIPYENPFS
jgi:hypothetical protein